MYILVDRVKTDTKFPIEKDNNKLELTSNYTNKLYHLIYIGNEVYELEKNKLYYFVSSDTPLSCTIEKKSTERGRYYEILKSSFEYKNFQIEKISNDELLIFIKNFNKE